MIWIKSKIMYFETEDLVKLKTKKISDGKIKFGNKTYNVDTIKEPKLIEVGHWLFWWWKRFMPLYFVHWRSAIPLNYDIDGGCFKKTITPENYTELAKQGAVRELLKVKSLKGDMVMFIIIGAIMGILLGILLAPQLGYV